MRKSRTSGKLHVGARGTLNGKPLERVQDLCGTGYASGRGTWMGDPFPLIKGMAD
jgi:hypothetical protein